MPRLEGGPPEGQASQYTILGVFGNTLWGWSLMGTNFMLFSMI